MVLQDGLTLPGLTSLLANFIILQALLPVRTGARVAEKCFLTRYDDLLYCHFSRFDEKKFTNKQTCKGNGVIKIKKYSSNTGKYHAPAVNKKVNDT